MIVRRAPLFVAAGLLVLSIGLPWSRAAELPGDLVGGGITLVTGREHAMRVTGAVAAVLVVLGLRRRSSRTAAAGLVVATVSVPVGLGAGVGSGRVVYVLAIVIAAWAIRPETPLRQDRRWPVGRPGLQPR